MPTMPRVKRTGAVLVVSGVLSLACGDALGPVDVAGRYGLESVNGVPVPLSGSGAPVTGGIILGVDRTAVRRITYRIDAEGTLREFVEVGRFRVDGSALHLELRENGTSSYVWRPDARLEDDQIILSYPHPADGPDIVELYTRR